MIDVGSNVKITIEDANGNTEVLYGLFSDITWSESAFHNPEIRSTLIRIGNEKLFNAQKERIQKEGKK
jgi:hypothetical protein